MMMLLNDIFLREVPATLSHLVVKKKRIRFALVPTINLSKSWKFWALKVNRTY